MVYGARAMTLEELSIAIAIDSDDQFFDVRKRIDSDEELLELCDPLLKLDSDNLVSFDHISVLQYLTSPQMPTGAKNVHCVSKMDGHFQLLKWCLTYLSFPGDTRPEEETLLEYATINWHKHGREVDDEPSYRACITAFLQNPSQYGFHTWLERWSSWRYRKFFYGPNIASSEGIFYAALFGLRCVAEELLASAEKRTISSALLASAYSGDIQITTTLLRAGAELTIRDLGNRTALHYAALRGNREIIVLLAATNNPMEPWLDMAGPRKMTAYGAWRDNSGKTALHYAAENGLADVIQPLLAAGAGVDVQDGKGRTALHYAARNGHREVFAALVAAGAQVGIKDHDGTTAVQNAVLKGHTPLIVDLPEEVGLETLPLRFVTLWNSDMMKTLKAARATFKILPGEFGVPDELGDHTGGYINF